MDSVLLEKVRLGVLVLGSLLVAMGAVLMLYFGLLVYQVAHSPVDVPLVQYAMKHINTGDSALYGNVGKDKVDLKCGDSVRTVSFLFLLVCSFAVLAGVVKAILAAGMRLMSFALGRDKSVTNVSSDLQPGEISTIR